MLNVFIRVLHFFFRAYKGTAGGCSCGRGGAFVGPDPCGGVRALFIYWLGAFLFVSVGAPARPLFPARCGGLSVLTAKVRCVIA